MIRYRIALLTAALFVSAIAPAPAQEQAINIYFQPPPADLLRSNDLAALTKAIQTALSQPPMQLVAKPFAGVLVIRVLDKVEVTRKQTSGTYYDFTVSFSRDGSQLGQSQQSCNDSNLAECTDQLVQDIKSVSAPR